MSQHAAAESQPRDANERAIDRALVRFLARQFPHATQAQCRLAGFVSQQLQTGHICLPVDSGEYRIPATQYCGESLENLLTDNPLISKDGQTPLVLDNQRLYLCRYWRLETAIADQIQTRLNESLLDPEVIREPLAKLFHRSTDNPDWQHIACALAGRKRFGIITGGPGTGKTTTVVRLLALLQQLAQESDQTLRIRLAAPTGKAAARLNESVAGALDALAVSETVRTSLPREAQTLHRLLGHKSGTRHFRHNARHPLAADLVVIDEASMIDIDQMVQLLNALPENCRLILVGDKDQLASVDAGAIMSDLCENADRAAYDEATCRFIEQATGTQVAASDKPGSSLAQQTVTLTKNWRSMDAPGISELAEAIKSQNNGAANTAFENHLDQLTRLPRNPGWIKKQLIDGAEGITALLDEMRHTQPTDDADKATIDNWASALLKRQTQQQLLTPLRRGPDGVDALNEQVVVALRAQHAIADSILFAGMPLLITRNLYDLNLMNGDLGLLLDHPTKGGLRAAFQTTAGIRWILPEQLRLHSDIAYALSVHKAQGSEFNKVLLHMPERPSPILTRELLYTAITRAQKQFILIESAPDLFRQALEHRTIRQSGLAARLRGVSG